MRIGISDTLEPAVREAENTTQASIELRSIQDAALADVAMKPCAVGTGGLRRGAMLRPRALGRKLSCVVWSSGC